MTNAVQFSRVFAVVVAAAVGFASFVGCGKPRPDGMPKLVSCSVTVLQDGKPLEGATVAFHSETIKWSVGGTTDAFGVAKMHTHGDYPGSPEGSFKVTIQKTVVEKSGEGASASASISAVAYDAVDLQYKTAADTPLTIDVSGKTNAEFEVGGGVKETVEAL